MAKKRIAYFEYLLTFLGFAAMYFFIVPDTDVFFFNRDYEHTVSSVIYNALYYGNGRLLGNIIGFAFSMKFVYAFLVMAVTLTAFVILMNKFFFDGDYRTVIPLSLAIAFPCSGFVTEVYYGFPGFVNYVTPFVFLFGALIILKERKNTNKNVLSCIFVFILSAASCLFSENTTVFIFTLSVLAAVYSYLSCKKIGMLNISFIAGTSVGGLIMFLIPVVLHTSHKLDSYRAKADSLLSVITSALAAFSTFADILSQLFVPLFIISAVFILLLKEESSVSKALKTVLYCALAFFPVEAFFYSMFTQYIPASTYYFIFQGGLLIVYAVALFVTILCLNKSLFKQLNICLYILTLSSFGPVLLAYMYGWRTFYIPYIVLIAYAIILLKKAFTYIPDEIKEKLKSPKLSNISAFVLSFCFLCVSFTVFIQTVYNYNFFVTRTQIISEKVSEDDTQEIKVPVLPCCGISGEDEGGSIGALLYKTHKSDNTKVTAKIYCDNSERYSEILNANPISATITAFKSLEFKNDRYIVDLLSGQ